jgi:poly(3-hydroxybutyrate) depolymerase
MVHPSTGGSGQVPIIFAFHGHGGTDFGFAEKGFEFFWPEAIVVYPQGLITKTPVDTNCKQSGWQTTVAEINCRNGQLDQDLKFFNAMLNRFINKYNVNPSLVFIHGWSNGADFVYNVLWAKRRNKLAALCPAGATLDTIVGKRPIPVMHVAGTEDIHVPFTDQTQTVQEVRTINKCTADSSVWATGTGGLLGTKYQSRINDNVILLQYDDGHGYPYTVPPLIVRFFKEVAADIIASTTTTTPLITRASPANKNLSVKQLHFNTAGK